MRPSAVGLTSHVDARLAPENPGNLLMQWPRFWGFFPGFRNALTTPHTILCSVCRGILHSLPRPAMDLRILVRLDREVLPICGRHAS